LVLLSIPAFSQYSEIVTTDDGQQVYVATHMVERSAPTTTWVESRIYRIAGGALQLFAELGNLAPTAFSNSSQDGASSLQVTGNGQSVAFVLSNACPFQVAPFRCSPAFRRAEIRGRGATVLGEALRVQLSRNGQWALVVQTAGGLIPSSWLPLSLDSTLINLETGEKTVVGRPATTDGAFALGSDGSVLQRAAGGPTGVWKAGEVKPLPALSGGISLLGMSDDASTMLVARLARSPGGNPPTALPATDLIALDMRAGTSRVLQRLDQTGRDVLLGMSNDGRRALFRTIDGNRPGPARIVDTKTGASTTLPMGDDADERAVAGTMSGSGNAAIVGTNRGRLLRFALDAAGGIASTEELLPATPYLDPSGILAPGALIELDRPIRGDIDWSGRIRLNNLPVAVIAETARTLLVQIPWELPVGLAPVSIDYPTESPLEQRTRVFVGEQAPRFVTPPPGTEGILGGRLIKSDFTGYVTTAPKPGEIVHMYMTGLGPVRGAVKTGEPAPVDDLRPLDGFVHCLFTPLHATEAETLFAGLAPGMVGIYQVSLRFPADTPDVAPTGIRCEINTRGYRSILQSPGVP
jgi:uncharacterized protein (TIGR03437 family)